MRKHILSVTVLLTIGLCMASCEKDPEIDMPVVTETKTVNPDLAIIEMMGFYIGDVIEQEDCYIVEGDIVFRKEDMESYASELQSQTRQARWGHEQKYLDIRVSTFALTNDRWKAALVEAMKAWNAIENCPVYFRHVGDWAGEVTVNMDASISSDTVAYANAPLGGVPGVGIRINPDWNYLSPESKISVMVHELGHVIAIGHTNYLALGEKEGESWLGTSHIAGTPRGNDPDPYSIMNQGSFNRPWGKPRPGGGTYGFTPGDILAAQQLYGTADYLVGIDGPLALLPGETGTYDLVCPELLQGYTGDFNTVWEVFDAEVVSETSTSVTIRNADFTLRQIGIIANVDYNGKQMSNGFIVNQNGFSGYYSFNDQEVTGAVSITRPRGIWANNVTVKNGGILTLNSQDITITEPFVVEADGTIIFINEL